ncbi:MAG: hypothetical protein PHW13_13205 [Methylococcales bacterium]|nr:hypothetical protein [Methylococcales bacterium]
MKNHFIILVALLSISVTAFAYDGQVSGQIDLIEGSTTANGGFPFVITLKNAPALCGNTNTSAYLLSTDSNFRVNASILLTAKSLGSTVTLSSNQDGSGYCQIMGFSIQ